MEKHGLSNATDKQDDLEIIENRFMDLKFKYSKVEEKHEVHVSLLDSICEEFDEEEEDTWINEIELLYEQKETKEKKMKFESNLIELEAHEKKEENGKAVDKNEGIRTLEKFRKLVENLSQLLDANGETRTRNPWITNPVL